MFEHDKQIKSKPCIDRYIPSNISKTLFSINTQQFKENNDPYQYSTLNVNEQLKLEKQTQNQLNYEQLLIHQIVSTTKIINYSKPQSLSTNQSNQNPNRTIDHQPNSIMEVSGLKWDRQALSCSSQGIIAVIVKNKVWINSQITKKIKLVSEAPKFAQYTAINWSPNAKYLSISDTNGYYNIADYQKMKIISQQQVSDTSITQLNWINGNMLVIGDQQGNVKIKDIRTKQSAIDLTKIHTQSIIRLTINDFFVASGSHDKSFTVFDCRKTMPIWQNKCEGSVYGLEWSPHNFNTLLSGVENRVVSWNVVNQKCIWDQQMDSDILAIKFSKNVNEFATGHGYKRNMIGIWKGEDGKKITLLEGHKQKVTMLDLSGEGQTLVSGGGDEVLKFWQVFPQKYNISKTEMNYEIR